MKYEDMKKNYQKAFTLIEMLVAITIFSLMIGTLSSIFISGIREQQRALATQKLLDETSYVLEYMSRAIRMATKDDIEIKGQPGKDCSGDSTDKINYKLTTTGQGGIKFRNYKNECQEFFLENNQLKERKDSGTALPMTSANTKIETLIFNVIGEDQPLTDNLQPRVTIFLDVRSQTTGGPSIKIQTTLSQRKIDIQY